MVERYRLTDGGETLTVDFTIEDADYLTQPFSGSEHWRYAPQLTLVPNELRPRARSQVSRPLIVVRVA